MSMNAGTMADQRAADPKLVGEVWGKTVILQSQLEDVLGQFEGPEGSNKPITVKTDLRKGRGDTVHFTVAKVLGGSVRRGDAELEGHEERPRMATYNVKVDQIRHAVGWTELIEHLVAAGYSVDEAYAQLLGSHFGRTKQEDSLVSLIRYADELNILRAGNRSSLDALTAADDFDVNLIEEAAAMAITRAATPANVIKTNSGAKQSGFILFGSHLALNPLKRDNAFLGAQTHADTKGDSNTLFRGGYTKWDGNFIYPWEVKDHDTYGPIGAPIAPKALLGDPVVAGTTAIDIFGSGVTQATLGADAAYYEPFKFFKGYPYKLLSHETITPDLGTYYFVIYNVSGPNKGKYGVYSYVGSSNNGNKITIAKRLGSAASGDRVTTLAGQTWDADVHTDAHPTGSLIIPVNALCVPFGYSILFGANALVRAYGAIPMKRIRERRDYDERKGMGYKSIYGQRPALDTTGKPRNYVLIESAVKHQGVELTYD